MKLIHEKFKEDINQHLQDFRTMLEGLEAHQIEFKGTMEKQSMETLIVVNVHLLIVSIHQKMSLSWHYLSNYACKSYILNSM